MAPLLLHPEQALAWLRQRMGAAAGQLRIDSRQVRPGDAFIAWPGAAHDGRAHVAAALQAGALACLVEAQGVEAFGFAADEPAIAPMNGLKAACGPLAAAWFGHPGQALAVLAVTGTNGKSSTCWWLAQAMTALGRRCGLVGTLGVGEPPAVASTETGPSSTAQADVGRIEFTGLTTPDPITLQAALRRWADAGFAACAIEASSIGISEQRLAGTPVQVAVFTNFSRDHLDHHGDMASYWLAKRALFDWPGLASAVVNIDDAKGALLADELQARGLPLWTTAVDRHDARLHALDLRYNASGLGFTVVERLPDGGLARVELQSGLIGDFNAHNLLAVLAVLRIQGVGLAQAVDMVPRLSAVPGRMQRVAGADGQPAVVVDFAHTPDALDKALLALRPLASARGGQLWCVFGCGGNRDASKRPLMGAIAHQRAHKVVLTSDNPRHERPSLILAQILAGVPGDDEVEVIQDRHEAIAQVLARAAAADVVLVAGKGHEDYQEVAGVKRPFSDLDECVAALRERSTRLAA